MKPQFPLLEACDPRTCTNSAMRRGERVIAGVYRKHLAPFFITSSQLSILFVTAKRGEISQVEMTSMLQLEKSSLSRNLTRLLDAGAIRKTNGRSIQITSKGKALLEEVIPAWENAKAEVQAILGDDGLQALELLKQKLIAS